MSAYLSHSIGLPPEILQMYDVNMKMIAPQIDDQVLMDHFDSKKVGEARKIIANKRELEKHNKLKPAERDIYRHQVSAASDFSGDSKENEFDETTNTFTVTLRIPENIVKHLADYNDKMVELKNPSKNATAIKVEKQNKEMTEKKVHSFK